MRFSSAGSGWLLPLRAPDLQTLPPLQLGGLPAQSFSSRAAATVPAFAVPSCRAQLAADVSLKLSSKSSASRAENDVGPAAAVPRVSISTGATLSVVGAAEQRLSSSRGTSRSTRECQRRCAAAATRGEPQLDAQPNRGQMREPEHAQPLRTAQPNHQPNPQPRPRPRSPAATMIVDDAAVPPGAYEDRRPAQPLRRRHGSASSPELGPSAAAAAEEEEAAATEGRPLTVEQELTALAWGAAMAAAALWLLWSAGLL